MNKRAKNRDFFLYGIAGFLFVLAAAVLLTRQAKAAEHPAPRSDAQQMQTASPERFAAYPEAKEAYEMAPHIKSTLDGLFCYCYCNGGGHYSLLDCFKDEHGAGCDICIGEARLAYRMVQQGKSLEEIRTAIDQTFGEG